MTETQFTSPPRSDHSSCSALVHTLAGFLEHRRDFKEALREMQRMAIGGALQVGDPFDTRPVTIEHLGAIRWFSRCARCIRDLKIPTGLAQTIRARLEFLQKKCWHWTFPPESPDEEPGTTSVRWALDEASKLLGLIKEHDDRPETSEITVIPSNAEPQLPLRQQ